MIPASNLEFMSQEKVGEIYNSFIPCPYNIFNEEFNGGVIGFDTWRRYECFDGIKFFGDKTLAFIFIKLRKFDELAKKTNVKMKTINQYEDLLLSQLL